MTLDQLKSRIATFYTQLKTVYWPRLLIWLEGHSPRNLFLRALLLGLLISVPWQCSRLLYQHYFSDDQTVNNVESPALSSPELNSGSITGMPRPGARRPVAQAPVLNETAPEPSPEQTATAPAEPVITAKPSSDREASVVQRVAPEYPASAVRKNESGTTLIRVELEASGEVKKVRIAQSSGSRALDRAAREAVSNWQFAAKIENGVAVESELLVPVDFKLGQ